MKFISHLLLACLLAAPASAHERRAGESFRDRGDTPVMVVIPQGSAVLGSTEAETLREGRPPAQAAWEQPRHEVVIARPFAVGKFHVTRREFGVFAKASGRALGGCLVARNGKWNDGPQAAYSWADTGRHQHGNEPALCVNWADANAYADWLSQRTGARYRLLSEDEWEYAARGGTSTARWWGDESGAICAHANGGDQTYAAAMPGDKTANLTCSDGFAYTSPAGHFPPNPFGLYDMLGNAWQWTADCFVPVAAGKVAAEKDGADKDGDCKARSIRGGSWHNAVSTLRPATRSSLPPAMRSSSLGFRVMRELP